MKTIGELSFGYNDAVNYQTADAQHLFELFFVENEEAKEIARPNVAFLVGEKGTGKTAYAAFLSSGIHEGVSSSVVFVQDTDYRRFVEVAHDNKLSDASYPELWKTVLLLLLFSKLTDRRIGSMQFAEVIRRIASSLDNFFFGAFRPQVQQALEFAAEARRGAALLAATSGKNPVPDFSAAPFLSCLFYTQKQLLDGLATTPESEKHILFLDGIDVRPPGMEYAEYIKCVKGLVNAVWSLNEDFRRREFFAHKNASVKFVLLIRPDILDTVGMQNLNNKMRDNAVMLDWQTNYQDYRTSKLFQLAERMLSSQQAAASSLNGTLWWDRYFPYRVWNNREGAMSDSSFIPFLRHSFYRPRDIITYLDAIRARKVDRGLGDEPVFTEDDFNDTQVRRKYSEYLLGEIKDSLSFYYASQDYELFLKFFEYLRPHLKDRRFGYRDFIVAYDGLMKHIKINELEVPVIFSTGDTFLQFLFELNVLCHFEGPRERPHAFMRWCYRERSYANIRPKVRAHQDYMMHYGIARALNAAGD